MNTNQPQHLTAADFDQKVIDSGDPVLVDFFADWCPPCRAIAPTIEALARDYGDRAVIAKVDVDKHPQLASRFKVQSIPTLIVFRDGEVVERFTGVVPAETLRRSLDAVTAAASV